MEKFVFNNYDAIIFKSYNKLNSIIAKCDFWRYLILYKYGGIYLDLDSTITKPLDDLISVNDEAIITVERRLFFVQWALIFNKGHPIMKRTIELVVNNILNGNGLTVHELTGPYVYSQAIREIYFEKYSADATSIMYNANYYNIPVHMLHLWKRQLDRTYYSLPEKNNENISKEIKADQKKDEITVQSYSASSFQSNHTIYNTSEHSRPNVNRNKLMQHSYRLYGVDYNDFFKFKIAFNNMYPDSSRKHWKDDTKPLLKNITIHREYENKMKFETYVMDNREVLLRTL
jgi:hypothetical protein